MEKKSVLNCPVEFDKESFTDLLSLSVGYAVSRQNRLGELVGEQGWNVDLQACEMKFGETAYKAGLLGRETSAGAWLWAWAETESGLPEIACAPSRRAKRVLSGVPEFANGKFMLDDIHTGHNLAMVAMAAAEKNVCYYRCPFTDGAFFMQLESLPEEVFAPLDMPAAVRTITEIISSFDCDHRLMCAGLFYTNGTPFESGADGITADFGGRSLTISFENVGGMDRICNISG